jgi:hypothetical protein
MMNVTREHRLLESFLSLLEDHRKDFAGYVRDVENVRYCHTPIDSQQLNRCEYALRNMEVRLMTIADCIRYLPPEREDRRDELVTLKTEWAHGKQRVDGFLQELLHIVDKTARALRPVRESVADG